MRTCLFLSILFLLSSCFRIPQHAPESLSISLEYYAQMPSIVKECSGLIVRENDILIHNDGGDLPNLYMLKRNGQDTIGRVLIAGTINRDWEAITSTEEEFIIADIGNNLGNRKDMNLYHIDKEEFKLNQTIPFSYPDQDSFNVAKHNFDAEAMIVKDGKYFVFTKNRGNKNTNIYSSGLGKSDFELIDSVALEGMVTDAAYHKESNTIVLLCYEFVFGGFKNSLALIKPLENGHFELEAIFNIGPAEQFEAIGYIRENQFLIGSENGFGNGRKLYRLTINGL